MTVEYNTLMPFSKRLFDLVFSLLVLIILSPIMFVTAILVVFFSGCRFSSNSRDLVIRDIPSLFINSARCGIGFSKDGNPLPDSERMTGFGRLLRSLSLDELPELFNILRGEMSFVGPRPLLMQYLPLYSTEQSRRHDVVPGLTGWAQVNGRNALDWPTRFKLDVWYVDHWSFWLDIKIILMTAWKAISREGINQEGQATVEYFKGEQ